MDNTVRFFSTARIESDDHKLVAITRLTTKCAGSERMRRSWAQEVAIALSIASGGMA